MRDAAGISIVIPTYEGAGLLARHLPGVLEAVEGMPVIVVDDGSSDNTVEHLEASFPQVKVVARQSNGGFSSAINDGIQTADTDFVVALNNDVEVPGGFLDQIMPLFEDSSVFAVSPRITLARKPDLDEGCKTASWYHGLLYFDQRQGITGVSRVIYSTACAAVYRRSMLLELGGFDEAYSPFYWEDADLGYRAWKRGWKSLYQPASTVVHHHEASTSKLDPVYVQSIKARNSLFFIWRNIEDGDMRGAHARWLPLILLRRLAAGDRAFLSGWKAARARKREADLARQADSAFRRLSDREILLRSGNGGAQ